MENTLLSPVMLWRDFNANEPLRESKIGEETYGDVVYSEMYFSGRETSAGRVRVFGVLARSKTATKKTQKGAILILPDMSETVNIEIMNVYVKQGYTVLMVDYRGQSSDVENYTKYPDAVSYANYKNVAQSVDGVPKTAKETCWYEWASVAKYAVSFLSSLLEVENIGVIGIRNGANVGWILCGTDARVDCFVPLFGAGWRGYRGYFKNSDTEFRPGDDQLRFLAGIDAHAYAQYVKCPVFYMTATNSPDFDLDRSVDTMCRLGESTENYLNFSPMLRDVLNQSSKRNVDLFLAKNLLNFKAVFPKEPTLSAIVEDGVVTCDVELDFSDVKKPKNVSVYIAEDGEDPSTREWKLMKPIKGQREDKKSFTYDIFGNSSFVNMFAVVEYRNGVTLSSKVVCKKTELTGRRPIKLLYSTKEKTGTFSVYNVKEKALGSIFFEDGDAVSYKEGGNGIFGVSSDFGLVTYKVNKRSVSVNDNTLFMLDVYCEEYTTLKVVLMIESSPNVINEFFVNVELKGGKIWQSVKLKAGDFKSESRISIKDYSNVVGMRLETAAPSVFNNILVV